MSNMQIGNITLTVDPNSISYVEMKNNTIVGASRGGPANVLPTGSATVAIKAGIIFPNTDDINNKLRTLIALKRGLPLINVRSDLIAALYFQSLTIKPGIQNKTELAKQDEEEEENKYIDLASLLSNIIISDLLNKDVISIIKYNRAYGALYTYLTTTENGEPPLVEKYVGRDGSLASTKRLTSDIKAFYKVVINNYLNSADGSSFGSKNEMDYGRSEDAIVDQFLKIRGKDSDVVFSNTSSFEAEEVLLSKNSADLVAVDLDTVEYLSNSLRLNGMDAYETMHPGSTEAGQEWMDKGASSYLDSLPMRFNSKWNEVGTIDIIKYGEDVYNRALSEIRYISGGTESYLSNGDLVNVQFVKQGYSFPISVSSFSRISPKDVAYINAAEAAIEAGTSDGVWDPSRALPYLFNDGYELNSLAGGISIKDGSSDKVLLPTAFRRAKTKNLRPLYSIPLSDLNTIDTSEPVSEFDMEFLDPDNQDETVHIRAKVLDGYNDFVNDDFYFLTLGRDARSLSDFNDIVYDDEVLVEDRSNTNPHFLNAVIGPRLLKDIGNGNKDYLHFFMPLSEAAAYSTSTGSSKIRYRDKTSTISSLAVYSSHIDSRIVTKGAVPLEQAKQNIVRAKNVATLSSNSLDTANRAFDRIKNVFDDFELNRIRREQREDVDKDAGDELVSNEFPGGWVPLAFNSISISTVPGQPKSLYAEITMLPFDYSPFTHVFGYIPTEYAESESRIKALDQVHGKYELNLANTPVVTNWLDKTYLSGTDGNYVGNFYGGDDPSVPDLIFKYDYPEPVFLDPTDLKKRKSVTLKKSRTLNIYSREKKEKEEDAPGYESIHNMHISSISGNEDNAIRRIPLQASMVPSVQHIGPGSSSIRLTFESQDLDSISKLKKIDAAMSMVARTSYHEYQSVKLQIVGSLISLFGNKNYVIDSLVVGEVEGKPEWYRITIDLNETQNDYSKEKLVKAPKYAVGRYLRSEVEELVDTVAGRLAFYSEEPIDEGEMSSSDIMWRLLLGEHDEFLYPTEKLGVESIPATLFGVGKSVFDRFQVAYTKPYDTVDPSGLANKAYDIPSIVKSWYDHPKYSMTCRVDEAKGIEDYPPHSYYLDSFKPGENRDRLDYYFQLLEVAPMRMFLTPKITNRWDWMAFNDKPIKGTTITEEDEVTHMVTGRGRRGDSDRTTAAFPAAYDRDIVYARFRGSRSYTSNPGRMIEALSNRLNDLGESYDLAKGKWTVGRLGFWGSYWDNSNVDAALNDRLRIIRLENYSHIHRTLPANPGLDHGRNYPAYVVHRLSKFLYRIKVASLKDNEYKILNPLRDFVKKLLLTATKSGVFLSHMIRIIEELAILDPTLAELIKETPLQQNGHLDLNLPTYKELYGTSSYSIKNSADLYSKISSFELAALRVPNNELRGVVLNFRKELDLSSRESFKAHMSKQKYADDVIQKVRRTLRRVENMTFNYESGSAAAAYYEKLLGVMRGLEKTLDRVEESKEETAYGGDVDPINLPTYRHLNTPARELTANGSPAIDAPARIQDDKVEPGWQYFQSFNMKPEEIDVGIEGSRTSISNTLLGQDDIAQDDDSKGYKDTRQTRRGSANALKASQITNKTTPRNHEIETLNSEEVRELSQGSTTQAPSLTSAAHEEIHKDKTKIYDYKNNVLHPSQSGYLKIISKVNENFQPSKLFDFRRLAPVIHLYFLREEDVATNIFEYWHEAYRFDAVTYLATTRAKESIDTAVVRMTNVTGILGDPYDPGAREVTIAKPTQRESGSPRYGDITEFQLKAGVKIQIRMGYSSIDSENDIVFVGTVAEVLPGKAVEIVAQGHGREMARHVEQSWGGSFNSFPTIITDLLRGTENLGGWEPFIFQENTYKDYTQKYASRFVKKRTRVGIETKASLERVNDTSNDNLWGLTDNGRLSKWYNFFQYFDGQKWYCNEPALENIYSMRRYIPNYVVDIRPYDQRGTLYFGPKDGVYIYTSDTKLQNLQYDKSTHGLSRFTNEAAEFYYSPSTPLYREYGSYRSRELYGEFRKISFKKQADTQDVIKAWHPIGHQAYVNTSVKDMTFDLSYVDTARSVYYLINMILNGDLGGSYNYIDVMRAHEGASFGTADKERYSSIDSSGKSWHLKKKAFSKIREKLIKNAKAEKNLFITIYSSLPGDPYESFGGAVARVMNKLPDKLESYKRYNTIGACEFDSFSTAIQNEALVNGDAALKAMEGRETERIPIDLTSKEIGYNIQYVIPRISKGKKFDTVKGSAESLNSISDSPIYYYAILDSETEEVAWAGYITFGNLMFGADSTFKEYFRKYLMPMLKASGNGDGMYGGESAASVYKNYDERPAYPIAPNKKPFRMVHSVFDNVIISNDIIATASNMANKITMWYPESENAGERQENIEGSDLLYLHTPFAPVLREELNQSVFDRNAASSAYGAAKATQLGMGYLGDGLREMYQGSITILGDAKYNPYDVVNLHDTVKDMGGRFEVKSVTHIYDINAGFTTTLVPHLMVSVNEDTEADAVWRQSVYTSSLKLLSTAVLVGGFLALPGILAGLAVAAVGAGIYAGALYMNGNRNGTGSGGDNKFLGLAMPSLTTVGYAVADIDGKISARRNPCRIDPMMYKGSPLVAGLDGWDKRNWTNREARKVSKRYAEIGRAVLIKQISDGVEMYFAEGSTADQKRNEAITNAGRVLDATNK